MTDISLDKIPGGYNFIDLINKIRYPHAVDNVMCKKLRFARWINKARAFRAGGNDFGDSAAPRVDKVERVKRE